MLLDGLLVQPQIVDSERTQVRQVGQEIDLVSALIIPALIPLAMRGVSYRPSSTGALLRRNLVIYGVGGVIAPFIGIKAIDLILVLAHVVHVGKSSGGTGSAWPSGQALPVPPVFGKAPRTPRPAGALSLL